MTREESYYEYIKLVSGDTESYDAWLNSLLEAEVPPSATLLSLVDCRGNVNDAQRCLHLYCLEQPVNESAVYERLRLELLEGYEAGAMTKDAVVATLFRYSKVIPSCPFERRCRDLSDYYELAEAGWEDMDKFDAALIAFLRHGDGIDMTGVWGS